MAIIKKYNDFFAPVSLNSIETQCNGAVGWNQYSVGGP